MNAKTALDNTSTPAKHNQPKGEFSSRRSNKRNSIPLDYQKKREKKEKKKTNESCLTFTSTLHLYILIIIIL